MGREGARKIKKDKEREREIDIFIGLQNRVGPPVLSLYLLVQAIEDPIIE
jgi:hypothetical protein